MKARGFTKETIRSIGCTNNRFPIFRVGDTIAISTRIKEGGKERVQIFQGDVIAMHCNEASTTFTVRKIGAHSIAVERIFPYHSPLIKEITIVKHGDVRRAKLYYIRKRVGKHARVKEKILTKEEKEQLKAS
jgi:large subunit ribosomal protein L19